ncbi:hypothetical protein FSP39_010590 [Pinctada imbricata]|uniref:Uncharacterized protein n=1 Tax=Pinctada imbricata TaxID=66713 RepID=A0AA89BZ58_PINIB|nr:hypothetical protein FSP39_010590 [Pinctada imbricata]
MIALLIRGATLEGSGDGITAVMAVNVDRIGEEKAWYLAFLSMIFRTVLGVGIYITIGSYNKFHNDTVRFGDLHLDASVKRVVLYPHTLRFILRVCSYISSSC